MDAERDLDVETVRDGLDQRREEVRRDVDLSGGQKLGSGARLDFLLDDLYASSAK
jgi:hypothetical protein